MRRSLAISAVLHLLALIWALTGVSAPAAFDVADMEALPVNIVPFEELTRIKRGEKTAPVREKTAPAPAMRSDQTENAGNAGDNPIDLESLPKPSKKPPATETAAAPAKADKAQSGKDSQNSDAEEAAPAPSASPKVRQRPTQDIPLPGAGPLLPTRPKPEDLGQDSELRPATAEAGDKMDISRQSIRPQAQKASDFNADEIAALLNKTDNAGGGAKRSTDQSALGATTATDGETLSQSTLDALRSRIQNNWSIIPGLAAGKDVRIQVRFRLDEEGDLIGEPEVTATGGTPETRRALMSGARRAVLKSAPFENLPKDKYDAWSEIVVNFDLSKMM